ncbi:MAG: hypothetical protein K8F58_01470, partial [Bauldia sp.]|nr:hypothetical protein [Bauldia sp.]
PHVVRPVLRQHPRHLVHRNPLLRSPAKPPVRQPGKPVLLVAIPVATASVVAARRARPLSWA